MSAISNRTTSRRRGRRFAGPRADDPRVVRTRAAVVDAARTLFLGKGYAGTTMEEIAELAGLTKRTVYNNYADKHALFTQIVADVIAYAEAFARELHARFSVGRTPPERPSSSARAKESRRSWRDTLESLGAVDVSHAPAAWRKSDGVCLVCFLKAWLNVKDALQGANGGGELDPVEREARHGQQDTGDGEPSQSGNGWPLRCL
jgi:AcrR family transcriptional regulator